MLISAVMAGWRRSLSRQRPRVGPMLPTGMPSRVLDLGDGQRRIVDEQGVKLVGAKGWLPERLTQGRVPFGCEQVLLGRLGARSSGMVPAAGAHPAS